MNADIQAISSLIDERKLAQAQIKVEEAIANSNYSPKLYCLAIQLSVLLDNLEVAFDYARDGMKLFPNDPDVLNNTGRIILDFKRSEKSIEYLERAILKEENNLLYKLNLYEAKIIFGKNKSAEKILEKILKNDEIKKDSNQKKLIKIILKHKQKKQIRMLKDHKIPKINKNIFWHIYLYQMKKILNKSQFLKIIEESKKKMIDQKILHDVLSDYFYKDLKDYPAALMELSKLIVLNPNDFQSLNRIGLVFKAMGKTEPALESFKKCYALNNKFAPAIGNLAVILMEVSQYTKAIQLLKEAIKISPDEEAYYINIATCYHEVGSYTDSQKYFERALKINPNNDSCRIFKIYNQASVADWSYLNQEELAVSKLGLNSNGSPPYQMLLLDDDPYNQLIRAKLFSEFNYGGSKKFIETSEISNFEKIRIGLFSADFHDFPGMHLMIGILEKINKTKFEIVAYSYGPDKKDYMRSRIVKAVDRFEDISRLSDLEAASLSRKDGINIAIHRNGYTKNHRTGIFSHGAAPIQVNYLGHPSTLGAGFIDYIIGDKVVIPNEFRDAYSEKVIYMPDTYQPTDDSRPFSGRYVTRADCHLPTDSFVLCCFNATRKIGLEEFSIWMKILNENSNTVLWLLKSSELAASNLKKNAEQLGVSSERLIFAERVNQYDHLDRHRFADLFLDNFIYNAHTTASDALWAGVPLVTKIGKQFSARVAASLLTAIDLPELVTNSNQEYEQLITKIIDDEIYYKRLRASLKKKMHTTNLFNTKLYTSNFENALETIFEIYRSGRTTQDIYV